eukprot:14737898-Ditylum_brightwellii.AAC.1
MDKKEEEKSDYYSTNDEGTYDDNVNSHDAASLRPHAITDSNHPGSGHFNHSREVERETKKMSMEAREHRERGDPQ